VELATGPLERRVREKAMNLAGKIIVVMITAMSIIFGTFALTLYVTHQDWRGMVDNAKEEPGKPLGLRTQLATLDEQNKKLNDELAVILADIAAAKKNKLDRLTELEAARAAHQKKLDDFTKKRADLTQVASDQGKKMRDIQAKIDEKRAELKKLRDETDATKAARIEAFAKAAKQTAEANQAQTEMDRLKARSEPLADQLTKLKQVLSSAP
jgi:chromosome segregation ATPase